MVADTGYEIGGCIDVFTDLFNNAFAYNRPYWLHRVHFLFYITVTS